MRPALYEFSNLRIGTDQAGTSARPPHQRLIVDGCVRDWTHGENIGLEVWAKGVTPNFYTQTNLFAYNIPIACGGVTVMPGDAIIGEEDGVLVVPPALTDTVAAAAGEHRDWEEFARMRLEQGGDLRKYYPLTDATRVEYEQWRVKQGYARRM